MIDCHVHAVPSALEQLEQKLRKHAPTAAGWLGTLGQKDYLDLPAPFRQRSGSYSASLDTERVVWMREHLPGVLNQSIEQLLSIVGAPVLSWTGTLVRLLRSMDQNDIQHSILLPAPPASTNDWVLQAASLKAPDRLIPVCVLPECERSAPLLSWENGWRALADRGAQGFKIHPNMDGLAANHPAYRALFQVASQSNRFVILHTGAFAAFLYRNRNPADPREFEPLFVDYPTVRVCLAHMNRDEPEVVWQLMRRYEQLYCDTSWQPPEIIRRAIEEVGAERVLLGSDWPLLHPQLQRNALDILRKATDPTAFEKVTNQNPMRFIQG